MIRSNIIPYIGKIGKTLNDDIKNGALVSVITIALACLAFTLFCR